MTPINPLDGFTVDRAQIRYIGVDLQRPECILAERSGTLWAADARGGVMRIEPDGTQRFIGQQANSSFAQSADQKTEDFEAKFTQGTLPNGLAFARNGDILISNFGTDVLEVMTREGATRTLYDRIDGQPIGKVNFVLRDSRDRIWITVSTRVNPWTLAASSRVRDGYLAVIDEHGLRVVADGFYLTNEIRLDAREEWLYIVETTGPHVTRMRLKESERGVSLVDREVYGPSHLGGFPAARRHAVGPRHHRPLDGQHHFWWRRPAHGLRGQPARHSHSLFPCPGGRTAHGPLVSTPSCSLENPHAPQIRRPVHLP
jgi:streptogramin lyase